jgi:hypothetical protein
MITTTLLNALLIVLVFLLSPILNRPDASFPQGLLDAVNNVQGFYSSLNPIFPVDALLVCIGIIVALEAVLLVYKAMMWLIKKIPMIS